MNRIAMIAAVALGWSACGDDTSSNAAINAPTEVGVQPSLGGAHVTWKDNSDNEVHFMIERKTGSGEWSTVGMVPFNTIDYHDANLTPGTTYVYRVVAMTESGDAANSSEVTFTAPSDGSSGAGGTSGGAGGAAGAGAGGGHTPAAGASGHG